MTTVLWQVSWKLEMASSRGNYLQEVAEQQASQDFSMFEMATQGSQVERRPSVT